MSQKPDGAEGGPVSVERAVERLSDDERLRGSLEDDGYGQLLTLASYLALDRARRFDSTDALYLALRRLIASAVSAAERGTADEVLVGARDILKSNELGKVKISGLGHDANHNARAIARALSKATGITIYGTDQPGEEE